jgi:RNA polymerase-interacting CarD/CdnL/TRCF family regulator
LDITKSVQVDPVFKCDDEVVCDDITGVGIVQSIQVSVSDGVIVTYYNVRWIDHTALMPERTLRHA